MRDFCKEVNARTSKYIDGIPLPVILSAYSDNSFKFIVKTPSVSYFLRKCSGIELGAYVDSVTQKSHKSLVTSQDMRQ